MSATLAERDFAARLLAESRDRLMALVRGLTAEQLDYKPAPARWSVAENLEHVTLVERRAYGLIDVALRQPPDPSRHSGYPGGDDSLIRTLRDRSHPRSGPEQIQPKGRWPHTQLFLEFEEARRRTCELLANAPDDLRARFSPHALFGELDCHQWFLVVAAHCDRHSAQSEEVIATEGFPRSAAAVR